MLIFNMCLEYICSKILYFLFLISIKLLMWYFTYFDTKDSKSGVCFILTTTFQALSNHLWLGCHVSQFSLADWKAWHQAIEKAKSRFGIFIFWLLLCGVTSILFCPLSYNYSSSHSGLLYALLPLSSDTHSLISPL